MNLTDLHQAAKRVNKFARNTPLIYDDALSIHVHKNIFLKLENLQTTGAFKIRGNANVIPQLTSAQKKQGIITATTGNHGIGFSYIAGKLHVDAIVVVPTSAAKTKVETIKHYGARVIVHGDSYQEASDYCHEIEKKEGRVYIGSFHSEGFFAGNASIALEILKNNPKIDTIIAPIGGGGLMSGLSFAAKLIKPNIKIYGVQAEGCPSMYLSIKRDHPIAVATVKTIADGVAVKMPSELSFSFVKKYVNDIFLVSDEEIKRAIKLLHNKSHIVAEAAGSAATAALIKRSNAIKGENIAVIVTGGNVDPDVLLRILQEKNPG